MGKGQSNSGTNPPVGERFQPAQPTPPAGSAWLAIVKDPANRTLNMKALVLCRDGRTTTLQRSERLYDLLDDLQRAAYRIYGLDEADLLEQQAL